MNLRVMFTVLVICLFFEGRSAAGQNLSEVVFSQAVSTTGPESPSASPSALHIIAGSGVIASGALEARITVAAQQVDNGLTSGIVTVYLDFGAVGSGKITVQQQVTCLEVGGKFAWIGATVTHSTNEDTIPVGTTTMTFMFDRGGEGNDLVTAEIVAPDILCSDRPNPISPLSRLKSGNYRIR